MVIFITTGETSGMDRYSQELAERLSVQTVEIKRYMSFPKIYGRLSRLSTAGKLIHFPNQHFGRYALFLKRPFIITVHDLVRLCFPFWREGISERTGLWLDVQGLKRADHIIAVSAYTKKDLVEKLGIAKERVTVVYNGINHGVFKPVPEKRLVSFPYFLYVGSERPRKNLAGLIAAFARLKKEFGDLQGLKLVKIGAAGRSKQFRRMTQRAIARLNLEKDVIFIDHVTDNELAAYYSSAVALVFPSFYEGFGLPPLEAMACGCPVITSNCSSLPEIVGDAGLLVDPEDTNDITKAMHSVITDRTLSRQLMEKGIARARCFSWDIAAEETMEVYRKIDSSFDQRDETKKATMSSDFVPFKSGDPLEVTHDYKGYLSKEDKYHKQTPRYER